MPLAVHMDAEPKNGLREPGSKEHVSHAEIVRRLIRERSRAAGREDFNMKTAKLLVVTFLPGVRVRADRLIA